MYKSESVGKIFIYKNFYVVVGSLAEILKHGSDIFSNNYDVTQNNIFQPNISNEMVRKNVVGDLIYFSTLFEYVKDQSNLIDFKAFLDRELLKYNV